MIDVLHNQQENICEYFEKNFDNVKEVEIDPHISILYGLNQDQMPEIIQFSTEYHKLHRVIRLKSDLGFFENSSDTVLKMELRPDTRSYDYICQFNQELKNRFDYQNKYPDYQPHITLAYLNPGSDLLKYSSELELPTKAILTDLRISWKDGHKQVRNFII